MKCKEQQIKVLQSTTNEVNKEGYQLNEYLKEKQFDLFEKKMYTNLIKSNVKEDAFHKIKRPSSALKLQKKSFRKKEFESRDDSIALYKNYLKKRSIQAGNSIKLNYKESIHNNSKTKLKHSSYLQHKEPEQ